MRTRTSTAPDDAKRVTMQDGRLALADAAVAVDEDTLAVNFDQNAVARDARGQRAF